MQKNNSYRFRRIYNATDLNRMTKKATIELLTKKSNSSDDRRKPAKTLSQAVKNRRSEIKTAARKLINDTFVNEKFKFPIRITNNGIKEWTNQPHILYAEKNEMLLNIKSVIRKAEYLGRMSRQPNDDYSSYLFSTKIRGIESWIIVRKYDRVEDYVIHSISDNHSIIEHLEKEEKDVD